MLLFFIGGVDVVVVVALMWLSTLSYEIEFKFSFQWMWNSIAGSRSSFMVTGIWNLGKWKLDMPQQVRDWRNTDTQRGKSKRSKERETERQRDRETVRDWKTEKKHFKQTNEQSWFNVKNDKEKDK